MIHVVSFVPVPSWGVGVLPMMENEGMAQPKRGTFLRLGKVYKKVGISWAEVLTMIGKTVI